MFRATVQVVMEGIFLVRSLIECGKLQILVINRLRVLESAPHSPIQFFRDYPPPSPTRDGIFVTTDRKCECFDTKAAISKFGGRWWRQSHWVYEHKGWKEHEGCVFSRIFFLCEVIYSTKNGVYWWVGSCNSLSTGKCFCMSLKAACF